MKSLLIILLLTISVLSKDFSLNGAWKYHVEHEPQSSSYEYEFLEDEPRMYIPNNWYKEGLNHGGVVWFQKSFNNNLEKNKKHFLYFKGVDYLCDIWLNGKFIGSHKGYFQHFEFEITDALKDGKNILKVKVNSPLENYPEHYSLHKTLLRGVFSHHDTRPGGAWSPEGQDKNSGGIWNDVLIKSYSDYKFEKVKMTPTLHKELVSLNLNFDLERFKTEWFSKKLTVKVTPANFEGESFSQTFTLNSDTKQNLNMELKNAQLWQTHDRGFPHLYDVTLSIGESKETFRTGFKTLVQNKNKVHFLNGESLYIKGTNYISSQYMSEMNTAKLTKDLQLMKDAHINTVRVHAHVEAKRFYDLCDEMGLLVWQDYNLQWGYTESKAFEKEAVKQAIEMVDLLYNHPSIYIWSMHNEPPWNSDWMKWKYSDYNPEQNKRLDNILYDKVASYDTYHLSKKLSSNLEHPWFGWYSGKYQDFVKPSKVPVITEYGAQAIPNFKSLKKFVPNKYLHPKDKKAKKHWEYHNFQFNWSEKNGVKFKKSTKAFIEDSQNYQADLIKFATEMLRVQKYDKTTAVFQFMFNEGWPSMNWGIVDYYREPKLGYEALSKSFAPVIIVAKQNINNNLEFFVVNDLNKSLKNLKATLSINGKSYDYNLDIPRDTLRKFAISSIKSKTNIKLILSDEHKNILATNSYYFVPIISKKELK